MEIICPHCGNKLDFLSNTFKIGNVLNDRITKTGKKFYGWTISGYAAAKILKSLIPYMITRKPQAHLAIEFQKHISDSWRYNHDYVMQEREDIRLRMKKLNK